MGELFVTVGQMMDVNLIAHRKHIRPFAITGVCADIGQMPLDILRSFPKSAKILFQQFRI